MQSLVAAALAILGGAALGCYRPPPGSPLEAAENFRSTVFELVGADDEQSERLNRLRLGMSDRETIATAGEPTTRESKTASDGGTSEIWIYDGKLSVLGTLTFENGRIAAIQTGPPVTPAPSDP